jgi:hypothetical protein
VAVTDSPSVAAISPKNRRGRCVICRADYKPQVHALRASGMTYEAMEEALGAMGHPHKRQTISLHFSGCLLGVVPMLDQTTAQQIVDLAGSAKSQAEIDFASMVQKRAIALMAQGNLKVTTKDGLQAQALLDRRLEKQADRELSLNMARLLSGSIAMVPTTVIEGRAIEVLAPPGLIEPRDA